jgi:hypothetical protein
MAGRLIGQDVNRIFKEYSTQLIREFSARTVFIAWTVTQTPCNNCVLDPVNKSSTGTYNGSGPQPFTGKTCPVCKAKGYIETKKSLRIPANVKLGKESKYDARLPEGSLPEGKAMVKVEYRFLANLQNATYFTIDGVRFKREGQPFPRGLLDYARAQVILQRDD